MVMAGPIDAVRAIHNAFRQDIELIDAAALDAARGKPGLESTVERFRFFNEVLEWHAHGEELAIFTALVTEMVMGRVTDYNELISAAYQKLKARLVVLGQLSAEMKLPSSDREKPAA